MQVIQSLYDILGIQIQANSGDVYGFLGVGFLLLISVFQLLAKVDATKSIETDKTKQEDLKVEKKVELTTEPTKEASAPEVKVSWSERLKKGLSKTRSEVWGKLESIVSSKGLTDEQLEEIEELLYMADIGPEMANSIIQKLEEQVGNEEFGSEELKKFLHEMISSKMAPIQNNVNKSLYEYKTDSDKSLKVIMVVGVNGAGKTTTIGKLATKLQKQGAHVVVGACDTFRAAAVDQLAVWCDRAGAQMVRAKENADPSGVAYEALQTAMNSKADYCILDTAGRLHTKTNLMDELSKTKRVLSKLDESAPHETLLVIDSITGQNAIKQAEEFNKALKLTGLIFTKCDGSSKAGNAVSIVDKLQVPITYIGVGEEVEDLDIFDLNEFLGALLAT